MTLEKHKYKLFGRFKGRKKKYLVPFHGLNEYQVNIGIDITHLNYNILDIGSGSGENAINLSSRHLNSKIITCELFEDGNINLYEKIKKKGINNISLYQGNVIEFLDKINLTEIFNEIWILFPDPWPKKRHHKRRLINVTFLKMIYPYLKKNSYLMIATDSQSYIMSILSTIYHSKKLFFWENQSKTSWDYDNLDLPMTKFYLKAKRLNRKSIFFKLKKI